MLPVACNARADLTPMPEEIPVMNTKNFLQCALQPFILDDLQS